jgi:hypothetical protein
VAKQHKKHIVIIKYSCLSIRDSTSWISCFATTRWSVVNLDPGKRQMNILLLVDTTIEGANPSDARQE